MSVEHVGKNTLEEGTGLGVIDVMAGFTLSVSGFTTHQRVTGCVTIAAKGDCRSHGHALQT